MSFLYTPLSRLTPPYLNTYSRLQIYARYCPPKFGLRSGDSQAIVYYTCMRAKIFSSVVKVSADDDLRAALAREAERERTAVSEVARRALPQALDDRERLRRPERQAAA